MKGKKILPPCSVCFFLRELETREVLGTTTKKWGTGGCGKKGREESQVCWLGRKSGFDFS